MSLCRSTFALFALGLVTLATMGTPAPYEADLENCYDGLDNDGDGLPDRDDSDCDGAPPAVETACDDGGDDDSDGWTDCEDYD